MEYKIIVGSYYKHRIIKRSKNLEYNSRFVGHNNLFLFIFCEEFYFSYLVMSPKKFFFYKDYSFIAFFKGFNPKSSRSLSLTKKESSSLESPSGLSMY